MKKSNTIQSSVKEYGIYMFTVDLYNNGLSIFVKSADEKQVKGIKTSVNGMDRFMMQRSQFENLIENKILEFLEIAPKKIRTEMDEIYEKLS